MTFQKGQSPWNKNLTKETDERVRKYGEKMSISQLGEKNHNFEKHWKLPQKTKDKLSLQRRQYYKTHEHPKGFKDKHHTEEAKRKIGNSLTKEKHWNWQNGKSFELYASEFNKKLKEKIRTRDNLRCQQCFRHQDELFDKNGKKYKLVIHHIDFNKKNNNLNNLISLCRNCHSQTNFKREHWIGYFQEKISR